MTPEGRVKAFIHRRMTKWFPGIWTYSPPGVGFFGKNGTPDRFYLWNGVFIAIEAKATGNEPTGLQMKRLKEIRSNGGVAAVVIGEDERKMEMIRDTILGRVQMANEAPAQTIRAPEGNSGISDKE